MPTPITIEGKVYHIVAAEPHWETAVRLRLSLGSVIAEGHTGEAAVAPLWESVRAEMQVTYMPTAAEADELRRTLGDATHPRVAMPVWGAQVPWGHHVQAVWRAELWWGYRPGREGGQLYTAGSVPTASPWSMMVPVLLGRLDRRPVVDAVTGTHCRYRLDWVEDGPWAYRLQVSPAVPTPDEWPDGLVPDWSAAVKDQSRDRLEWEAVGVQREAVREGELAPPRWGQQASFQLAGGEIGELVRFWVACGAQARAFAMPVWFRPGADRPETPHVLWARFGAETLELQWTTPSLATAKLTLWETDEADVEMPAEAYLLDFIYEVKPTALHYRFTDWERDLQCGGNDWAARPFELGEIEQSLMNERQGLELRTWAFEGNPVMKLVPFHLEGRLRLEVWRVDPAAPAMDSMVWSGDVEQVTPAEGRAMSVKCGATWRLLDMKAPRVLLKPGCNHRFGDVGCGLNREALAQNATLAGVAGATVVVSGVSRPGGWFTGGVLEAGSGETFERRPITSHAGSQLNILKPLRYAGPGSTVRLYPVCNRSWEDCARFGNQVRFSGFRAIPEQNPTVQAIETAGGGRKGK